MYSCRYLYIGGTVHNSKSVRCLADFVYLRLFCKDGEGGGWGDVVVGCSLPTGPGHIPVPISCPAPESDLMRAQGGANLFSTEPLLCILSTTLLYSQHYSAVPNPVVCSAVSRWKYPPYQSSLIEILTGKASGVISRLPNNAV